MSDIKTIISEIYPAATFEEGECLLVNIEDKCWHEVAEKLKNDPRRNFDVLTAVVGMDWKESL